MKEKGVIMRYGEIARRIRQSAMNLSISVSGLNELADELERMELQKFLDRLRFPFGLECHTGVSVWAS